MSGVTPQDKGQMMNYYYECNETKIGENLIHIEWNIYNPSGEKIAEATTEENANLIVTLMNGEGNA